MAKSAHDDWQSGKTLAESASFMFDKGIDTDVTFNFPTTDETIKAHQFVLKAKSHVFFMMFHSGLDKPREDIEITDIEPAIFKQFLRYLYLDDTKLTITNAPQLTYCADKYGVKSLKAQCMGFLVDMVNRRTWAEILDHAVFYNDRSLIQACLHFLKSCKSLEIKGLQEYHITKESLEVILDYEKHSVREVEILKFCETWAEQECKKKEVPINMINKRTMLGPLLKKIPLCSMEPKEFVTKISGRSFLTPQEELQIFRYLSSGDKANPPFPCMKPKDAKDEQVSVKLPDVWDTGKSEYYHFSIRCAQSFTLLGLTFTEPGIFSIKLGSMCEDVVVQPGCLTVYLKEAVHCEADIMLSMQPGDCNFTYTCGVDYPFDSDVNPGDSDIYEKVDFVITKLDNHFGRPPFDALIVKL